MSSDTDLKGAQPDCQPEFKILMLDLWILKFNGNTMEPRVEEAIADNDVLAKVKIQVTMSDTAQDIHFTVGYGIISTFPTYHGKFAYIFPAADVCKVFQTMMLGVYWQEAPDVEKLIMEIGRICVRLTETLPVKKAPVSKKDDKPPKKDEKPKPQSVKRSGSKDETEPPKRAKEN